MGEAQTKIQPPQREPLPAVYPLGLIEVACRALEAVAANEATIGAGDALVDIVADIVGSSLRIIRDGLASHEAAAREGRSRG